MNKFEELQAQIDDLNKRLCREEDFRGAIINVIKRKSLGEMVSATEDLRNTQIRGSNYIEYFLRLHILFDEIFKRYGK